MTTFKHSIIFTAFIFISLTSINAQISRNDSLVNFLCGDWMLFKSDNGSNYDKMNEIGNIKSAYKIHFDRLNDQNDSISCLMFFDSTSNAVKYRLDYGLSILSSNIKSKEWTFWSKGKKGLPNLLTRFSVEDKDTISFIEACSFGFHGYFVRKANRN